jgi:uncharacterized protein (TIGR00725 family)
VAFTARVAVIGGHECSQQEAKWAEAVGRALAERGAILVCGGGRGVMEAACRGAKQAGGMTVGILPGLDAADANPYVSVPIVTGLGEARNAIIIRTSQAAIAIGGEYGTLSEIAFALKRGLPVAGLDTWELRRAGEVDMAIHRATSPEDAVEWVMRAIMYAC